MKPGIAHEETDKLLSDLEAKIAKEYRQADEEGESMKYRKMKLVLMNERARVKALEELCTHQKAVIEDLTKAREIGCERGEWCEVCRYSYTVRDCTLNWNHCICLYGENPGHFERGVLDAFAPLAERRKT